MDIKKILEELQEVKQANEVFLNQREGEILALFIKEDVSAEEALQQEIMMELLDKMQRVNKIIKYLNQDLTDTGTLSRDAKGNILFNGELMAPMQEFEVYLYDNYREAPVWTRTFVSMSEEGEIPYLVGLERNLRINGLRARIRKQAEQKNSNV